ncbi:hypothetical protein B0J13DRAFT_666077 [Dactylonectria estremocensis]|uniref:F-box domain-containing protein n=1 Tax=Dactylonectria estremocensis TaxID=1079267 RepID=A0A9P9EVX5_9HYPO|nr:hypothetical protein B0J13DRAFT_666077 [Dactylonectria estremocensis]
MASPPISRLPLELHHVIISYLTFPDAPSLRATSRFFASLIPAYSWDYTDLVAAEDSVWAERRRRLACVYCARMRRASAFTEKQKAGLAEFRACYKCQKQFYEKQHWGFESHELPESQYRTRFNDEERKIKVDRVETGICIWCHNRFTRWGNRNANRGICTGCFHNNPRQSRICEAQRLHGDLKRIKSDAVPTMGNLDGEHWGEILDTDETAPYYSYEWLWPPLVIPIWKGGERGVTVRKREDAGDLCFLVTMEPIPYCSPEAVANLIASGGINVSADEDDSEAEDD